MQRSWATWFPRVRDVSIAGPVSVRSLLLAGLLLSFALVSFAAAWRSAAVVLLATVILAVSVMFRSHSSEPERVGEASGETDASAPVDATLRSLLTALPDSALVLDPDGKVVAANAAADALFPGSVGRHISSVSRAPELLAAVATVSASGVARDAEVKRHPPQEQALAVRVARLDHAAHGKTGSILVLLRDVTEQQGLARMRA